MNLDAIKNRLQSLQNTTTKQNNLWKPEAGTQQIRIVPYQHQKDMPFIELYFHYGMGGKNYLSPITFGRPDPIVEFAEKLKSTGNKDDWKLGKSLEPKMRAYAAIVVRGKESEGVKFWGFGKQVYTELLSFMADPDYGDITDPAAGRDISVEFVPSEGGASYPKTSIRVKPNQTPVSSDKSVIEKLTNQPNLTETLFKEPTYEELQEALAKWLNPEESADETASGTAEAKPAVTADTVSNATDTDKVTDVGAAFSALFNK